MITRGQKQAVARLRQRFNLQIHRETDLELYVIRSNKRIIRRRMTDIAPKSILKSSRPRTLSVTSKRVSFLLPNDQSNQEQPTPRPCPSSSCSPNTSVSLAPNQANKEIEPPANVNIQFAQAIIAGDGLDEVNQNANIALDTSCVDLASSSGMNNAISPLKNENDQIGIHNHEINQLANALPGESSISNMCISTITSPNTNVSLALNRVNDEIEPPANIQSTQAAIDRDGHNVVKQEANIALDTSCVDLAFGSGMNNAVSPLNNENDQIDTDNHEINQLANGFPGNSSISGMCTSTIITSPNTNVSLALNRVNDEIESPANIQSAQAAIDRDDHNEVIQEANIALDTSCVDLASGSGMNVAVSPEESKSNVLDHEIDIDEDMLLQGNESLSSIDDYDERVLLEEDVPSERNDDILAKAARNAGLLDVTPDDSAQAQLPDIPISYDNGNKGSRQQTIKLSIVPFYIRGRRPSQSTPFKNTQH